ncbi:putative L-asparaginase [Formosimonas limnophila]|uniref:Putative L-asparaginase n=1 Tax=Formosimonas limnophila TaxID=1384487 RepID=A0A8J3CLD1_9BURK|nr:asparaginase [Formosimonas limnophila]GHA73235.1 putative L-asparaginase [Formosimonas limnophila]
MKIIQIIFTGGTIAMRTNDAGMLVPAVSGEELVTSIPALQKIANIKTNQFANIPSAQVSPRLMWALRNEIINYLSNDEISGVVVVHGTDTMEETAFFLDGSLSNAQLSNKPVVLTGAMRSNDQLSADGMANLLAATRVAAAERSRGRGVMVVMNDEIHSARYVKKMDTSCVQTFQSPQHMPIGSMTHSSDDSGVRFITPPRRFTPVLNVSRETCELPRVDIISMYAGADAALFNASIAAGAQAVVVQGVGASSVNLEMYTAIESAIAQGVAVVIASRSPLGMCAPVYGYKGGGKTLAALGAAFAHDLPAHKARLYAQLLLGGQPAHAPSAVLAGFAQLTDEQADWA